MLVLVVLGTVVGLIVFTRLPLGFVMMLCGLAGISGLHPRGFTAALAITEQQIMDLALNYQFSVLPLFILMGVFVVRAGLADELFEAARRWVGHYPGGLGMATILACGGFSAMSASSSAASATMAHISVPAMQDAGYDNGFAAGSIAAGGTMGILIPPSSALIIYALLTQESVSQLFVAGIVPGLIQVAFYVIVMMLVARLTPHWAPKGARYSMSARLDALWKVWGVLFLFGLVMVGLVRGWFTATEAGGIGAGGAFLFVFLRGKLTFDVFTGALLDTARIATMIFFVASGALVLNQFINLSGLPGDIIRFIEALNLSPPLVVLCLILFYVCLGCLMDGYAMIFLTVPIVAPIISGLGYDLVWWGIVTVLVVEISLITPPVGLNVFILKALLPELPIRRIFMGIMPYLVSDVARLILIVLFPAITLFLPSLIG